MPVPGFDTYIVDEPMAGGGGPGIDTLYLLSTAAAAPDVPTVQRTADTGDADLDAQLRAYFDAGGRDVVLLQYGVAPAPTLAEAVAMLPAGPGQVVAPEAVTSADLIVLAGAWAKGKVALLNGPDTATDAQLITLAAAVQAGVDGRGAALFADYGIFPVPGGATTTLVPWSIVVAGLIARNDQTFRNPNLAAAGMRGTVTAALGVDDLRDDVRREALHGAQINSAKDVGGSLRNYGFRTLADLGALPHWWDLSGSRTIMAFRGAAAGIDEAFVFEQIDGTGRVLGRYESALRSAAKDLYDVGALYGATPDEAYAVDVGPGVNPVEDVAAGELKANVRLKTSPFAEHLVTNITRRALTAAI